MRLGLGALFLATTLSTTVPAWAQPPPAPPGTPPTAAAPPPAPPPPSAAPPAGPPAPPPPAADRAAEPYRPRPAEIWVGLGFGNAVCDHEKPESKCPVDGGSAFALGGGWRLHPSWTVGLELAGWNYKVREAWRGTLQDPATKVTFMSTYLAVIGRWYWLARPGFDGYLQGGLGVSSVRGIAENNGAKYEIGVTGTAYVLGVGADWHLGRVFRLGPQALAYLQKSTKVCEKMTGTAEECRSATSDQNALPWRLMVVGTFMFGGT